MDFTEPQTVVMSTEMITGLVGFLVITSGSLVYAYAKLIRMMTTRFDRNDGHIAALQVEMTSMKQRNLKADEKTESLDQAQRTQENTIAVMANDTSHVRQSMIRMESSLDNLTRIITDTGKK